MFFDPLYLMMILPCIVLAMLAQGRVKATFSRYSKVACSSGLTGAEAAGTMLSAAGLAGRVRVERVEGFLSDHYDPRAKVLRLSPDVFGSRSLAAVGVACHEVGHAIQDAKAYGPLVLRNAIVPTAAFGSNAALVLIMIGLIFQPFRFLAVAGLVLFAVVVVFQLVNLPVEFNASARARQELQRLGIVRGGAEAAAVGSVLNAAAMTYVAATVTALVQLLYYAMIVFGGRRSD